MYATLLVIMLKNRIEQIATIVRKVFRPEILAAVVVAIAIIAVSYNTSGIILQNYRLEKQVREAQQKVAIAQLELESQALKNKYYQTDAFLDIAARKQLSKGLEGEKLVIVPKSVALSYVNVPKDEENAASVTSKEPKNNIEKWLYFLSGDLEFIDRD
jgi:cell division protein FtsB